MTAAHEARVHELFAEALHLPPAARDAWLRALSEREPAVSAALADLLARDADAARQGFLDTPLSLPAAADPDAEARRVGQTVGAFVLREWLATGGTGSVYRATRRHDFEQQVAVKLLRLSLFSGQAERRFLQERQLLAGLNHPHIARFLDGGTTAEGRPYFVMEYIAGKPITTYCADAALPLRRRLELFRQVCLAVHHAHQRLILHRDLKPGNVLVTEAGEPKLLDFGIARVLDSEARPGPDTHPGQLLGTPAYMSPEQAGGAGQDIRTDVYALGVLGYEMLAGRLPYDLKDRPLLEQLNTVREQEPERLGKVHRTCCGDLETLFAKALEKEPDRRYPSVGDLAADVGRYLRDEPIQARPPNAAYVLRKFARRNPVVVGGAAALLLLLAAGVVALLAVAQARVERAARDRLFAESQVLQARRQVQLGEFERAVDSLAAALAAGHPEQARLRVERAKILIDLGRNAEAERELEDLATRADERGEQAAALLYLGGLRAAFDAATGLLMVRQAVELGLTEPAERGFAAGLLAETSEEAVAGFLEAVRTEPTHRRANEMLVWTLLLLGRREEARQRLAVLQSYYPTDGRARLGAALLAAYDRSDAAMEAHLRACQSSFIPTEYAVIDFSVKKFRECLDFELFMDKGKAVSFLLKTIAEFGRMAPQRGEDRGGASSLSLPPVLQKTFGPFIKAWEAEGLKLFIPSGPLRERLAEAVQKHPEGTLWLLLAIRCYQEERYKEALDAAERALLTPALLNIRVAALETTLLAEAELYWKDQANYLKPRTAVVRERLQAMVSERGIRARNGSSLTALANALGERELARSIAAEFARQDPKSPHPWDLLGIMESKLNNKATAIEQFQRALKQRPDAKYRDSIERRLKRTIEEARKQAAELLATPKTP